MDTLKWTLRTAKKHAGKLLLGIIISGLGMMLTMVNPVVFARIIDNVFRDGLTEQLVPLLVVALGATLVRASFVYGSHVLIEQSSQAAVKELRNDLYEKLQSLDGGYYGQNRTGDLMMKLTGDLDWVRHFLSWIVTNATVNVVLLVVTLTVFLVTDPLLTLLIVLVTPLTVVATVRMRRVMRPAHDRVRAEVAKLNTLVQENISGNRVVKAFVREDYELARFEEQNQAYRDASTNTVRTWWRYAPYIEGMGHIVTIIILFFGGLFVIRGRMSVGGLSLFLSLAWGLNEPMRIIGIVVNDFQRFMASADKIMTIFYAKPDIKSPPKPQVPAAADGHISMKNAGFSYSGRAILKNIDFEAKPGQTIGIMGPTGSGKTTLTMLIARFLDVSEGRVLVDGVDVRDYDLYALRSRIGMSMQDVFLFSDTIDANIAYGKPDAPDTFIMDCARDADAHDFIRRMPQGYDTIIGERGVGLSGGQRQRIALARALAYGTPVLILDDTTSAVDMETEHYIQERLRERSQDVTTIIVAQRVSSVRHADRIYILEDGRITEAGTHRELLEKKGYYYRINNLQQGIGEDGGEA